MGTHTHTHQEEQLLLRVVGVPLRDMRVRCCTHGARKTGTRVGDRSPDCSPMVTLGEGPQGGTRMQWFGVVGAHIPWVVEGIVQGVGHSSLLRSQGEEVGVGVRHCGPRSTAATGP